jgi:serine protease Do
MNNNVKSLVLASVLSSAATLGAYKMLDLDKNVASPLAEAPSAFTRLISSGAGAVPATDFTAAAEKSTQAVVHIKTTTSRRVRQQMVDPFEFFGFGDGWGGGRQQQQPAEAAGSGVIISSDGYIVTNNHVVQDADEVKVIMNDKREFKAKVISTDPNTDLAVIQVKASGLPFLTFGNSDEARVGEWVLAVGNPFNLESTVTAGIVSAKGRNINIIGENAEAKSPIESFIQTDAAVNPGNSGGALVNLKGELIGINTAIASRTGQFAGYSFAVPTSIVRKVTGDLIKYGAVQRGYLGIRSQEVNGQVAEQLDLKVNAGVYVSAFEEGSAAKAAGLKIGDVIVKVDGVATPTFAKLTEMVGRKKPGESVVVTINRDGTPRDLNVTLKNRNGNTALIKPGETVTSTVSELGAKIATLSESERARFKLQNGVKVTEVDPDGRLGAQGIEPGFILLKINNQKVNSAEDVQNALENASKVVRIEGMDPTTGTRYLLGLGM